MLGGFFGGRVDDAVLFAITCRLSIPVVLVALAVVGLLGSSLTLVILVLGLLLWDRFAVVARVDDHAGAQPRLRRARPGRPDVRRRGSCWREVLPNIASHLAVVATLEMALAILLEATLSLPRPRRAAAPALLGADDRGGARTTCSSRPG